MRFETSYETVNGKRAHCLKGWKLRAQEDWGKHEEDQDKNAETPEQTAHPEHPTVQPVRSVQRLEYFSQPDSLGTTGTLLSEAEEVDSNGHRRVIL
jgi:hypothetical protein